MKNKLFSRVILLVVIFVLSPAHAELQIDIISGNPGAYQIAIIPFHWDDVGPAPQSDVSAIVKNDLVGSGQFKPLADIDLIEKPYREADVKYGQWNTLDTDYMLIGRIRQGELSGYVVDIKLLDIASKKRLLGFSIPARQGELRVVAHYISDLIYEKIIGLKGAFSTRIAYVTVKDDDGGPSYQLIVADADGYGPRSMVTSKQPLMSPTWSPDSRQISYVSFEKGNSSIYIQSLVTGQRTLIASYKGINGAPAFSPGGKKMALALSKSGNLEIYVMDLSSQRATQLTHHYGIDTEPAWTPDGRNIIFTSDRGGKPQLYEISVNGGKPTRLTRGQYNARATISYDNQQVAMVNGENNVYRIALLNRKTGTTQLLSIGALDESPSFSPNGSMILYASRDGDRGVLNAVSSDGSVRQRLILADGDVREPAWSPFTK